MSFLDWQSDGAPAFIALVLYGFILLVIVIRSVHHIKPLTRLIPAALLWHFVIWCFIAFWMLPHYVAESGADAEGYHDDGMRVAGFIRSGSWENIDWKLGTDVIPVVTGILYAPFGGDIYGALLFSAALGFCGGIYLCRAFSLWAAPDQLRNYALVILFLPSLATWTSILGKDSWIYLGLGLAAYGYSSMLRARAWTGAWHLGLGLVILTAIRPHISATLVVSMAFAYTWGLTQARRGSVFKKAAIIVLLFAMTGVLYSVASGFLGLSTITADSIEANMELRGQGNTTGGSSVEIQATPGVAGALRAFPSGVVRVLFQPFPWEVKSFNSGLAAAENLFLLWFFFNNVRRLRGLFRGLVREPYLLFSSIFAFLILFMFSLTPNLGLLSRERAQLLPFLFALLVAAKMVRTRGVAVAPATFEFGYARSAPRSLAR